MDFRPFCFYNCPLLFEGYWCAVLFLFVHLSSFYLFQALGNIILSLLLLVIVFSCDFSVLLV